MLTAQVLLDLEHGIHALCWDIALVRLVEEKRGVLAIKNHDVYLLATSAMRVDDECTIGLVPVWKVILEDAQPIFFGGLAAGSRMGYSNAIAAELALETRLKTVKNLGQSVGFRAVHQMMFSQ